MTDGTDLYAAVDAPGGAAVTKYAGGTTWNAHSTIVGCAAVINSMNIGATMYVHGDSPCELYRLDLPTTWTLIGASASGFGIAGQNAIIEHEGRIYAGCYGTSNVFRLDSPTLTNLGSMGLGPGGWGVTGLSSCYGKLWAVATVGYPADNAGKLLHLGLR
jgi:hypothetical protein